ncbi:uncharacterized protein LOC131243523 [Magnolia sinica]|uniref:uncharacterized protein LOC131243523 n=1 Tax=Magnolia sinica TaxID=86752 RepID=UPI002659617C|nr:uncharacterized protein LOC131243523 [Magnolia sinica]XP_058098913.1 uncharacterized protein LOC131243523 [Magnolia sinica]XP_058098914.1 uncharacterized protein LOC131243523 [Magnolia sinica]XP_058098915.1 uncharacterized protein LOC131243523 [Magnolia sinica]
MPLEDFFTLTEMKDGLATLARVEELVAVMQTAEYDTKNLGDAARQWSTVASILAATGNEDCLNHFIHLGGLRFLDQWLQVAQKHSSDTDDSPVEASISAVVRALEKLPIDKEQSIVSQIVATLKHLFSHKSSKIQEEARALFDSWNQMGDKDMKGNVVRKGETCCDDDPKTSADVKATSEDGCTKSPVVESPSRGSADEKPAGSGFQHSDATRTSDASQAETCEEVKNATSNQEMPSTTSNHDPAGSSPVSNTCQESLPVAELSSIIPSVTSMDACSSPITKDQNVDVRSSGASELEDITGVKKEMEMNLKEGSASRFIKKETCAVSTSSGHNDHVNAQTSVVEPDLSCDMDAKESKTHLRKTASADLGSGLLESQPKSGVVDAVMPKYSRNKIDLRSAGHGGESYAKALPDLGRNGCIPEKSVLESSSCRKDASIAVTNAEELSSKSKSKASKAADSVVTTILKPVMGVRDSKEVDKRMSEMELEYGEDDALEVARLVARQVEREVVDYREPFCSSSTEKNLEEERPGSPDSVEGKQDELMMEQLNDNETPMEQDSPGGGSSPKAKRLRISNSGNTEPEGRKHDSESPRSAVVQESGGHVDKSRCDFDLNEDVCTEEIESLLVPIPNQANTLSAPIAVVAASKGAPSLPTTPLHFEGELGWRGSAATSAFRPASPRRTPDGEKTSLVESSSKNSKPRQNFLEFDLNVAERDSDAAIDLVTVKPIPASPGLPSGDSSMEVSSRRAERFKLDLNCIGDNDDACPFPPSDWRVDGHFRHHQNGNHSPSPASSSSSKHPSMRDFDLNDHPSFYETRSSLVHHHGLQKSSLQDTKAYGSLKLDDPVVSSMGSRMAFDRKEFADRTHLFLANSPSSMGMSLARAGGGYGAQPAIGHAPMPPHAFSYNSLTMGPTTMSLSPQLYGPAGSLPYMFDSRGATGMPQVLGQSSAVHPLSRQPLLMNLTGSQSGLNGFGVSQTGLDLNSGLVSMDGESRDMGAMRQLFSHGGLQPASTGMSLKRKEPECGWELNLISYKQEMPWH